LAVDYSTATHVRIAQQNGFNTNAMPKAFIRRPNLPDFAHHRKAPFFFFFFPLSTATVRFLVPQCQFRDNNEANRQACFSPFLLYRQAKLYCPTGHERNNGPRRSWQKYRETCSRIGQMARWEGNGLQK
jgi:hypothetical protein